MDMGCRVDSIVTSTRNASSYSIGAYLRSANLAEGRRNKRMIENLVRQDGNAWTN